MAIGDLIDAIICSLYERKHSERRRRTRYFEWPARQLKKHRRRCYIVITMNRIQVRIRRIGNSHGIVIAKPRLAQHGLERHVEITIERDALVLRRPTRSPRSGWAAAQKIAGIDDTLVIGEFGNDADAELTW
jgi:antitoxin MazE